ncbi:MAG: exodeoxyribonuclease III [Myxococcales bacterium]|nr:exodeoxyribonuclease III [Myxococcales bacterium]
MKLASWNVNSVRARHDRVVRWLDTHQPDVLCLQELKCTEDKFPYQAMQDLGYHAVVYGQPTYNGVAILARDALSDVTRGWLDGEEDPQARLIAATVKGVRVITAYVPNGGSLEADRYQYKLKWLKRLRQHLDLHVSPDGHMVLCGDFNVAPDDIDVALPEKWKNTVLCHPSAREAYQHVADWGLHDTLRKHRKEGGLYSWWDYRQLGFPKNDGLRLDLILASRPLWEQCAEVGIDRNERKGKLPSDHVPVMATFTLT